VIQDQGTDYGPETHEEVEARMQVEDIVNSLHAFTNEISSYAQVVMT